MDIELILSFLSASVVLTVMPGPDNIFVLTESLTNGKKTGIAIALGLATGVLVHTIAAATGLSLIIKNSEVAFSVIKYLGAAYLFYLAFLAFKDKGKSIEIEKTVENETHFFKLMRKGFVMNVLNPKVALFFLAFLPQFVNPNGINVVYQMIVLGVIFMLQTIVIFCLIAISTGTLSKYLNSPKFWKITKWSKVVVLSSLAILLVIADK